VRLRSRRSKRRWTDQRTLGIGAAAVSFAGAALVVEYGRIWRRGSAPMPSETTDLIGAAEVAVGETVEAAVVGYQDAPARQNATFNLLWSFAGSFVAARSITTVLRTRPRVGPFRDMKFGRRHIHHFVPGIVIAFAAGGAAIVSSNEDWEPLLAIPFGTGLGLTLDESALLLQLEDVYWTEEGILSVQITLAVLALVGALSLGLRFLRRGETIVLDELPSG
jgi:hypothetical protein